MLSASSKGAQPHASGQYTGGAVSIFNQSGTLTLNNTQFKTNPTTGAAAQAVRGQLSVESGGSLSVNAGTRFNAATDLSIVAGAGDITIAKTRPNESTSANSNPWAIMPSLSLFQPSLAQDQLISGCSLSVMARNGNLVLDGTMGTNGYGSSQQVALTTNGDLTLVGNNVTLRGSKLRTNTGAINLIATTGALTVEANKVTQYHAGLTNTYWDFAELAASSGINVRSAGNMQLNGLWAWTWGHANFQSGSDLTTSGKINRWQVDNRPSAGSSYNGWYQDEEWVYYTSITGNQGVTLGAMGGHLRLNGTNVNAINSTATLQALGDVRLEAAMNDRVHAATSTGWKESCFLFFCQKTTWTTYHDRAWRNANPVNVSARDIRIKAGNNVATYASKLTATNNLRIEAGDQALYYAVKNETDHSDTTYKKKSFIGFRYDKSTEHNTSRISTPVVSMLYATNGNLTSFSGGDQLFQGTDARYTTRNIQAGVGEKARADARIILEGVKTSIFQQRTKESDYVVWQRKLDQGSVKETLTLPSFTGPDTTPFKAPGGISVQIPEGGEFKTQIQTLSKQPGMAYLNELSQRKDVNWQPVKLAFDQWSYKQEGLTPAGAALLGVAVAVATGGMGAELLGTTGTATSAAANAAFSSLAAQASITLVNNKGNIGKTLKDLAKSDIVKATIAAALTAGVLDKLNATQTLQDLSKKTGFSDKLTYNLINAGGRALTNTAINGGNLEDALKQALIGGLVDTVHGQVASQFKVLESEYLAHKLAHALAGCVAGAAASGTCKDGAIGGAVGEIVAEMFKGQKPGAYASTAEIDAYNQKVLGYSKLVAGAVSAYSGGNAQTAITTAETAVRNNFLTFNENQLRKQAADACKAGNAQACADEKRWDQLDVSRDDKVRQVCSSSPASQSCTDWRNFALLAKASYSGATYGRDAVLDMIKNGQYSDAQELQSIQRLLSSTPYAYGKDMVLPPHLKTLVGIVADLTPIVGDAKAFYEAKDPFDYTLAVVGALGPVGDGAAAAIRAAKAAHQAGNATEVANQLQKVDYFAKAIQQVNGRLPINSAYAGKIYPSSLFPVEIRGKYPHGIPFTAQGFPDFSRYSISNVNIELGATRIQDFLRADAAAGYTKNNPRPSGYTWHHHQESGYMQLIPTDLHFHVKHTGGIATAK
ncbi:MAG: DUF637 domain-containing protein [Hydrogenophaga sp.]|nr:DUF637 domain-containing protein [Hydrogenophaga sp.]